MRPLPKFTVIIPTYNWSSVLPYSIGSALRQTMADFELLVVGDGCTDDSEAVVKSIADSRVRWINLTTNSGHQSAPNNEGLRQAQSDYIAYLGHDDLWLPNHLELLAGALNAGATLAYNVTAIVNADGTRTPFPDQLGRYVRGLWIPPSGVAHRRQAAIEAGGWPLFADVDCDPELSLWERIYDAGGRIEFVPRLTTIKLSAALRKDSYKRRSADEQEAWAARIVSEPDLEATELVQMLPSRERPREKPFSDTARAFAADIAMRVRRRLFGKPQSMQVSREELFNQRREFKGLSKQAPPGRSQTLVPGQSRGTE